MTTTTTFFHLQSSNRRKSILLLVSVALLLGVFGFAAGYAWSGHPLGGFGFTAVAVLIGVLTGVGAYFGGDRVVLAASKAKPVTQESHPQLMNVVREISLAANVPVPKVHIIEDSALNAFATGRNPEHASIAVTTSLLQRLDREELQSVIAHELGHARNLATRFALLVGVLVGGIALAADLFLRVTFWGGMARRGGSRGRGGGGGGGIIQIVMLVLALVLAIAAPIAARLVQLSVSREREYLADAT